MVFDNKDASIQHNFVLFNGKNASAPQLFSGTVITGPAVTRYIFTAPPPGTYFFHCEIHPIQMTGTATVTTAPAAAPTGGSPGATPSGSPGPSGSPASPTPSPTPS